MSGRKRRIARRPPPPSYQMCVDCQQQQADPQSFAQGEEWPARCPSCWGLRRDSVWARKCVNDGYAVPTAIYADLLEIEAQESDSADDRQVGNDALMVAEPSWMTDLPQGAITPDIEQLVAEAFSPLEDRSRTFWEWLTDFDARGAQMAQKLAAAKDAQGLIQARTDLIAGMTQMFQSATDLRRRQLEAFLNEITLREQITEKLALAGTRLGTLKAIEVSRQQKLLEAPKEPVSRNQQVVGEHREELQARAAARRAALADFRSQVADIMAEDIDDGQKAHELRAVLESYRLSENAFPKHIRQFLADIDIEEEP